MNGDKAAIRRAIEAGVEQEQRAKETWDAAAEQLRALIPESLNTFCLQVGWRSKDPADPPYWDGLARKLRSAALHRERGDSVRIRREYITELGLTDVADLEAKMQELARAWDGIVEVRVNTEDAVSIVVLLHIMTPPQE